MVARRLIADVAESLIESRLMGAAGDVEVLLEVGVLDAGVVVVAVGLSVLADVSLTAVLGVGVTVGTDDTVKGKLFVDEDVVAGNVAGTAPELPLVPSQRPWHPVTVLVVALPGSRPFTPVLALVAVLVVVVPVVVVPVVVVPVVVVPVVVVPVVVVPVVVVPVVVVPVVLVSVLTGLDGATLSPAPSAADAFEDVEVVVGVVDVVVVVVAAGVVEVVAAEVVTAVAIGAAVTAVDAAAVWAPCALGRIASTSCSGERWSSASPASLASARASRT